MINNEVKQRVRNILEVNKDARDCDRLLISIIWSQDVYEMYNDVTIINAKDFLFLLEDGDLTSSETIRRCRQRLQEENESLRGYKYKLRKQLGEEVRNTISK
jgi:hypothetical protein